MSADTPYDVLVYGVGSWSFVVAEYPEADWLVITAAGGSGGAASDGTPGEPGTSQSIAVPRSAVPPVLRILCGAGGRGDGGRPGEDGYVIIELYDDAPTASL